MVRRPSDLGQRRAVQAVSPTGGICGAQLPPILTALLTERADLAFSKRITASIRQSR
jgi:hypothetical protein